jgi:beta-galactosidase/beta-glucuronidase
VVGAGCGVTTTSCQRKPSQVTSTVPQASATPGLLQVAVPPASMPLADNWRFSIDKKEVGELEGWYEDAFDDSTWMPISLPHTWNVIPEYADYSGLAWYRQTFIAPAESGNAQLRLRFEAVFYLARVWLNGQSLGQHEGGYTPFEFDASEIIRPGQQNVIAVQVDNRRAYDRIPADLGPSWSFDWWNYGGIIRDVVLEITSPAYIARHQVVSVPHLTGIDEADTAAITAHLTIRNVSDQDLTGTLQANFKDDACKQAVLDTHIQAAVNVPAGENGEFEMAATLDSPKLWHFDHPNLYCWSASLIDIGGQVLDTDEVIIGVRSIELKSGYFYLNGEPVRLVGVNRHADYPGRGSAETVSAMAADYDDLKTLNEVFTRPVHYPQAESILDYADRHGILLIPEVPAWQLGQDQLSSPRIRDLEKQQLSEMIAEDFNHPSVWAWSIGNEFASNTSPGHDFVQEMIAYVKSLDPTRPVGYASDKLGSQPQADATAFSDFVMMNEYFGTWHGTKPDLGPALDRIHQTWPDKTVIISEFGFTPHWNAMFGPPTSSLDPDKYYFIPDSIASDSNEADAVRRQLISDQMPVFRSKPFVAGAIFWSYQDYRTPSNFKTGLVDAERNKRGSWELLRDEYAPTLIDSVTFSPEANGKRTARVALHTRGPVDVDMPVYTLRGYALQWTVISKDSNAIFAEGDVYMPILTPGSHWASKVTLAVPEEPYIFTVSIVRPTGFSVTEQSFDALGQLLH